ncbi:hypothetical protein WMY93_009912 [Mugilogobius chulae]|uniref:Integrase catalytic domain-containing protein n=1 Tax=Mugilogobius chulae TaxID=88201 RepID=A0AAW0PC61_9GOBI
MVVVPKKCSPDLRLCVDFTGLNEYVCREKYVLPSVEQSLGMLAGAKVFSKLDANMGFWQIPLSEESAKLTTFITPFGVLAMYDPNRDTKVSADASSYGLGGVLLQLWEEGWRPVAYASRFVEIALLNKTRSMMSLPISNLSLPVTGIPEVLMSDNGPQFSGQTFADFSAAYGFKHVTSSPRFPQSNGEAERAVQTVKNLLKKAADPYLALLAYRATPLQNGYSPAELLMGRRLRTTLPTLSSQLDPTLPDSSTLAQKEREKRMLDIANFNRRHRAKPLCNLAPGEQVWVTDTKTPGTVVQSHSTPRSYTVDLPQGTVRRNRMHPGLNLSRNKPE